MTGEYKHRKLDVAFTLGEGSFGEDGTQNTITLTGLRVAISVNKAGQTGFTEAQIRVFGMSLSDMNKLATLGTPLENQTRRNFIGVAAGSGDGATSIVFQGNIQQAWADMNGSPQVPFTVLAHDGGMLATKPVPATSYKGAVDVATVMARLAVQNQMTLENNGVSVILNNPNLWGSPRDQIASVATQANINYLIEDMGAAGGKLVIWPKGGTRGGSTVLLSPETGMVGYPAFWQAGIVVKTLYNPTILFGSRIEVKSELTPACGFWSPANVTHDLESETPGGQWFTTLHCITFGHAPAVIR
jgi:hypothetical protein